MWHSWAHLRTKAVDLGKGPGDAPTPYFLDQTEAPKAHGTEIFRFTKKNQVECSRAEFLLTWRSGYATKTCLTNVEQVRTKDVTQMRNERRRRFQHKGFNIIQRYSICSKLKTLVSSFR